MVRSSASARAPAHDLEVGIGPVVEAVEVHLARLRRPRESYKAGIRRLLMNRPSATAVHVAAAGFAAMQRPVPHERAPTRRYVLP